MLEDAIFKTVTVEFDQLLIIHRLDVTTFLSVFYRLVSGRRVFQGM